MSEPDQFTIILWIIVFCSDKGVGSNLTDEKLSNLTDPKLPNWFACKNLLVERLFLNESTVATKIKSSLFILIIVICRNSLRYIFFVLIGCSDFRIELIHNRLQSYFKRHVFHGLPRIQELPSFCTEVGNFRNRQATRLVRSLNTTCTMHVTMVRMYQI